MIFDEPLQRSYRYRRIAIPRRPKSDIGRLHPHEVQRMGASGRGVGSRARKMVSEQIDDSRIS